MNIVELDKKLRFTGKYLSRSEAAEYLGGPYWYIQTLLRCNKINAYRIPKCKRFYYKMEELDRFKNYVPRRYLKESHSEPVSDSSSEFFQKMKLINENIAQTNIQLGQAADMIRNTNQQLNAVIAMLLKITESASEEPTERNSR